MSMSHKHMWFDPNSIWPHGTKFLFLLFLIKKKMFKLNYILKEFRNGHMKIGISGDFLGGSVVKNSPSNAGDSGLIPALDLRSYMLQGS